MFDVDLEVANESQTIKNMIEGERAAESLQWIDSSWLVEALEPRQARCYVPLPSSAN